MATTTPRLNLTKPDGTDLVDIAVINANYDKIDAASAAGTIVAQNYLINGGFDIWQRGTTFSSGFFADRWDYFYGPGTGFTKSVSKLDLAPADSSILGGDTRLAARLYVSAAGTGNDGHVFRQKIEGVETLAGQTVTMSFWARNNTSVDDMAKMEIRQNFGTGGSAVVYCGSTGNKVIPGNSTWARYSGTITLPSIAGKTINTSDSFLEVWISTSGNRAKNIDFYGIQLERGAVMTAFRRNANSIQGELAACQRYYYRAVGGSAFSGMPTSNVGATNSSEALGMVIVPVVMRAFPTSVDFSALRVVNFADNFNAAVTNVTLSAGWASAHSPYVVFTASGMTAGNPYRVGANNNGGAYLGLSAEL